MIRLSQWAEIRQMHVVDGVPKKQIAERLGLDIKTVRRAVAQATAPARRAESRPRHLDRWRAQIEQWLRQDRRLTAKRIRRLLLPLAGPVAERTVRWYVARLKAAAAPKEVYVHRSPRPGVTLEVDFGESWAEVAGVLRKVKYVVATLPYSNVYFAKAYPIERLESLLDGIQAAFASMGGVTDRVVLDNTTIAVKQVLTGRDRVQTDAFQAFRGAYPFAAAFCAPATGWEKGSVETGVTYVRNLVFRPRPTVASWAALNALIITELEADVATRRLADGRPVREAWTLERRHLRALPVHLPETLPRRGAGGRQVRARPGGPGDLLGADPLRLPACVGEAVSRPRGGCRRHRGRRQDTSGRFAPGRWCSIRSTCCRCWNASTAPSPRRRPCRTGRWRRCGSRSGPPSGSRRARRIRSGSGCCGCWKPIPPRPSRQRSRPPSPATHPGSRPCACWCASGRLAPAPRSARSPPSGRIWPGSRSPPRRWPPLTS